MKTAVVIPLGPGRGDNIRDCIRSIQAMSEQPEAVVIVCDGPDATFDCSDLPPEYTVLHLPRKHEPGMEQPRNAGVRIVEIHYPDIDTVWFLDSDILVDCSALSRYKTAMMLDLTPRVLVGPYEWLPEGVREPRPEMLNDARYPSFNAYGPTDILTNDLSAGLACFGGNLVWPVEEFIKVGGFWDALHHGRCEDGELGLRAVACGVPISFVREARGWHLAHAINFDLALERNRRDVPMLNERHPWVQGEGLFVVEEDGKRFDVKCPCGWSGSTMEIWAHQATCNAR